jgi:hypothetical protein
MHGHELHLLPRALVGAQRTKFGNTLEIRVALDGLEGLASFSLVASPQLRNAK